jgi:hypothetical protein
MARKTIRVSDKSGQEIADGKVQQCESRLPMPARALGSSI